MPYGYIENDDEKINFTLPKNFKKELLFDDLPFVAQLNNAAIENVVKGKENDDFKNSKISFGNRIIRRYNSK